MPRRRYRLLEAAHGQAHEHHDGARLTPDEQGLDTPLFTPHELRIALMLADGHTHPEIAVLLGCGYQTVKTHTQRMRQKSGCQTAAALVAYSLRKGMIQ